MTRRSHTVPHTLLLGAAAWVAAFTVCVRDVGAQEREPIVWTQADVEMAVDQAPAVVQCITFHESSFQPYAVGAAGEQGPIQLLPSWLGGGQWSEFLEGSWTSLEPPYRSVNDPFLTTAYLVMWGERSGGSYWPWHVWTRFCR